MNHRIMKQRTRIILVALPLIAGVWLSGCNRQPTPLSPKSAGTETSARETEPVAPKGQLPDWSLGESDSNSLGVPYKMSQFEIRPPESFRFIKSIEEPITHAKTYYWVGPARADETYPQFMVIITELSARDSKTPLANLLKDMLRGIEQRRQEWIATPPEHGTINGLPFVRSSWSGVATSAAREGLSGQTMHGVVYLTVHDNHAIQIMCQDVAPDHAAWIKQGDTAALSFRVEDARP